MKETSKQGWRFVFIIGAVLAVLFLIYNNKHLRGKLEESNNNIEALTDTLSVTRNKDSSQTARIMAFETQSTKDFLKIQSQDAEIIRLQNLVRENKSKLKKPGSSATIISSETVVDNTAPTIVYERDTIRVDSFIYIYPEYTSNINMKDWVVGTSKANKNTTQLNLKIKNNYSVIIGSERKNIFSKSKNYAEVTSENPYTDLKTVRTYRVSQPSPKKLGVGLHVGYGVSLTPTPVLAPTISIGLNYNLIRF